MATSQFVCNDRVIESFIQPIRSQPNSKICVYRLTKTNIISFSHTSNHKEMQIKKK